MAQDGLLGASLLPFGFLRGSRCDRPKCAAQTVAEEPLKGAQTRGTHGTKGQQRWEHGNAPPAELPAWVTPPALTAAAGNSAEILFFS